MVTKRQGSFWLDEEVPGHAPVPCGVSAAIATVAAALLLLGASPAGATVSGVNGDLAYESGVRPGIAVVNPSGEHRTPRPGAQRRQPARSGLVAQRHAPGVHSDACGQPRHLLGRARRHRRAPADPRPRARRGATWSPDSGSIAFESTRDGDTDIYVMSADGTAPRCLTSAPGVDQHPAWSPDGRRIAFESSRNGNIELYVMSTDGSAQTRLTFGPLPDRDPPWSPDGREIAFVSRASAPTDLFAISPDSGRTRQLTTDAAADESPAWSPDGRQIAFSSKRGSASVLSLYVIDADGAPDASLRALGVRGRNADWGQLPPPAPAPTPESTANATPTGRVLVHVRLRGAHLPPGDPARHPARHPPRYGHALDRPARRRRDRHHLCIGGDLRAQPVRRRYDYRPYAHVPAVRIRPGLQGPPTASPAAARRGALQPAPPGPRGRPVQHWRRVRHGMDNDQSLLRNGDARDRGHCRRPRPRRQTHRRGPSPPGLRPSLPSLPALPIEPVLRSAPEPGEYVARAPGTP
jgi:hypothetical protein